MLLRVSTLHKFPAQRLAAQHGPQLHDAAAIAAAHGFEPRPDDLRRREQRSSRGRLRVPVVAGTWNPVAAIVAAVLVTA